MDFNLRDHTLLLTVAGSRAYGIHKITSDVDVKGVGIAPRSYYLGFLNHWEQAEGEHMAAFADLLTPEETQAMKVQKLEGTVYELRKFLSLAADNNPNILDVLFCRDEEVRLVSPTGQLLRDNRVLFLSAKAKHTFSGYAAAQLKRIRGHRKWLLDPPTHPPTRAEYGLPEHTLIPADQLAAARAAVSKRVDQWEMDLSGLSDADIISIRNRMEDVLTEISVNLGFASTDDAKWLSAARDIGLDANLIYVLQREREYDSALRYWKQFKEWERSRNKDRASLEAQYGYDTKHAGHLIRLLRMGKEIMTTGKVHVWRGAGGPGDAEEILSIRNGAWTYDQVVEYAEREDEELNKLYASKQYVVPKSPDRNALDALCIQIIETMLRGGR